VLLHAWSISCHRHNKLLKTNCSSLLPSLRLQQRRVPREEAEAFAALRAMLLPEAPCDLVSASMILAVLEALGRAAGGTQQQ